MRERGHERADSASKDDAGSRTREVEQKQETQGTFGWLKDLFEKSEEEVFQEAGQDVVIYLAHIKYSMILFWVLYLLSGNTLFCLYLRLSFDRIQTKPMSNISERMSILAFIGVEDAYPLTVLLIFFVYVVNVTAAHI